MRARCRVGVETRGQGRTARPRADWQDSEPGFLEIDLMAHEGGSPTGDHAQTLDPVDVATGWTETMAVKNKAPKWVFQALEEIIRRCPFPVRGIDSDNGAESSTRTSCAIAPSTRSPSPPPAPA